MEKEELREHLTARATWVRGLYMLLFAVIYSLAELVLVAVVVFQFLARLITGEVNARLLEFGQQLSRYLYDMLRFFTFNSEEKPYPFAPWKRDGAAEPAPGAPAPPPARKSTAKKSAAPKKRAVTARRPAATKSAAAPEQPSEQEPGEPPAPESKPPEE